MSATPSQPESSPRQNERAAIDKIAERLAGQFPQLPRDQISQAIKDRYEAFEGSPIREFIPVLVERSVRSRLSG